MNIFVFDNDLSASAEYFFNHDPQRAQKQIFELCQMLAYAMPFKFPKMNGDMYIVDNKAMKNNPMTKWVCAEPANTRTAFLYLLLLRGVYKKRYGKAHACELIINKVLNENRKLARTMMLRTAFDLCNAETEVPWISKQTEKPHENIYEAFKIYLEMKLGENNANS
jgi:hypothetical protein